MVVSQLELPLDLPSQEEKEENGFKIYLSPEEIERVFSCCPRGRNKLILRVLWRTGLRELLSLKAEDIDWENATLTVISLKQGF